MKLGIVGHAAEKFNLVTEAAARGAIAEAISRFNPSVIVSGRSPMGGVDIWAEELAAMHNVPTEIYPPKVNNWGGPGGFRDRNIQIAKSSDHVLCVVVAKLPEGFKGMTFKGCYHCKGRNPNHVKSGGCWTAWRCKAQSWEII